MHRRMRNTGHKNMVKRNAYTKLTHALRYKIIATPMN